MAGTTGWIDEVSETGYADVDRAIEPAQLALILDGITDPQHGAILRVADGCFGVGPELVKMAPDIDDALLAESAVSAQVPAAQ